MRNSSVLESSTQRPRYASGWSGYSSRSRVRRDRLYYDSTFNPVMINPKRLKTGHEDTEAEADDVSNEHENSHTKRIAEEKTQAGDTPEDSTGSPQTPPALSDEVRIFLQLFAVLMCAYLAYCTCWGDAGQNYSGGQRASEACCFAVP